MKTVVCIASGPSLTAEDCAYVRGKAFVIAVNDAHRLAPWADVLYSSDRRWWPFHDGMPSFTGQKVSIGSCVGKANPFHKLPEIRVLKNTGYDGIETDPTGLRNGKNSGYAAVNLAVHHGAQRIVLLGYNMGRHQGRQHFFGNHPPRLNQSTDELYMRFRKFFGTMVEPLRALGIEVINCTPDTRLECFPVRPLREVLPETLEACA